jgi:PhnB protein
MTEEKQANPSMIGIIPYINVEGAQDASAFYERAFGARELARIPAQDGQRLMHCHLEINGGSLMLSDCFPELGLALQPSQSFTMHLQVSDVDAWWERAVAAGAEITVPLQLMFWGDRYGKLRDPFGVNWSLSAPAKEL